MKTEAFKQWLSKQGAEVLASTNQYELVRFRARGAVHSVFWGRRGITFGPFAQECHDAFKKGGTIGMGFKHDRRGGMGARYRHALVERDGLDCFFCLNPVDDATATIEHLVGLAKGGPNHIDNLVLAHRTCNETIGGLPLIRKLAIRERHLVERAKESAIAEWKRNLPI